MSNRPSGFMFDVYGTVCDWHTTLCREAAALAEEHGATIDASQFARDWRNGRRPMLAKELEC